MINEYTTKGKNNFDLLEINNDKMRPYKRGLYIPCTKNIFAFDFEVLTYLERTLPVMLGIAGIDKNGNILEKDVVDRFSVRGENTRKMINAKLEERRQILLYLLNILTRKKYRSDKAQNFFYNIKYDFGILVSLMDKKEIEILYYMQTVQIDKYIIEVVGNKMFIIKKEDEKRQWIFYDLANFTKESLDRSSKKWLGEELGGKTEGFDTAEIFNDIKLLKEKYKEAKQYCLNDVIITARLALEVRRHFENMEIPFSKPISTASLFKAYMGYHKHEEYPEFDRYRRYEKLIDKEKDKGLIEGKQKATGLQKTAWEGYFGGLFEMFKRGYFKDVIGLDYNSMYPSIMIGLPDLRDCEIEEINPKKYSLKRIKKADWGVIKAKVWTKKGKIQLFPVRANIKGSEKIIRPQMTGQEVIMTKQMLEFFTEEYPHFKKIEITGGYMIKEGNRNNNYGPARRPFGWMEDLYNERIRIINENGKEDKRQEVIKLILNAGYGITAETIKKEIYTLEKGRICYNKKVIKPGKLFRPFYAFHITELSRLQIYKDIFQNDIEEDCIGIATDCIFVHGEGKEKLKNSSNYAEKGKPLGKLMLEKEGEMLVVGNGIYQFRDKEGNIFKTTRGFNEKKFPNLFEEGHELKDIPVYNKRALTWGEVAYDLILNKQNTEEDCIGLFFDEEKYCNINMDISREWETEFKNVADMFNKQIESKPLTLKEEKR
ncbi:MAG: hypothetical protein ACOC56_03720 [Atribacterota bacterium]